MLNRISIPESVIEIGSNAFMGCSEDFTIVTVPGSYVESYARSYGYIVNYGLE